MRIETMLTVWEVNGDTSLLRISKLLCLLVSYCLQLQLMLRFWFPLELPNQKECVDNHTNFFVFFLEQRAKLLFPMANSFWCVKELETISSPSWALAPCLPSPPFHWAFYLKIKKIFEKWETHWWTEEKKQIKMVLAGNNSFFNIKKYEGRRKGVKEWH